MTVSPIRDAGVTGEKREAWVSRFFQTIDAMDAAGFAQFFTPDGSFRMGNAPAFVGREAIETFVEGFFAAIAGIGHDVTGLWETDTTLVSEGVAAYRTHDGRSVSIGYLGILEFDGDLIRDYRVYQDAAPLMAALSGTANEGK